jgi:hypothetical protein
MKNIKFLSVSLVIASFMAISPQANSKPFHIKYEIESIKSSTIKNDQSKKPGRKNKDGSYKRKKGFMWGLFKKKSSCDCPKH